ncbi:hypothetical protein RhiirC2_802450 [Rhizophagus irregularis]|uniref:Uncharacterized protein n=1 Tax=Rhizophagus irregularis TaxID=588596 RepID=A0A2N1M1A7_9GLOM|nr:hypothetical protein RhiirC2_802450 [Rhizophagus irregularis]
MSSSERSHTKAENFDFEISFKEFHVTSPKRAGHNKIYDSTRSKSFFFELADPQQCTNNIQLKIHTNDFHMKLSPIHYKSTSRISNTKFQISNMLRHFFSHQQVIPRRIQQKYFNLIRLKLLDRIILIKSRGDSQLRRNTLTKTFFNFSYKRYCFHFGIFLPCSHPLSHTLTGDVTNICTVPCPYIMSYHRRACIDHHTANMLHFSVIDLQ